MVELSVNITKQDQEEIDDFVEYLLENDGDYTYCSHHGRQPAVGNHDECEQCLIDYKNKQIVKLREQGIDF